MMRGLVWLIAVCLMGAAAPGYARSQSANTYSARKQKHKKFKAKKPNHKLKSPKKYKAHKPHAVR